MDNGTRLIIDSGFVGDRFGELIALLTSRGLQPIHFVLFPDKYRLFRILSQEGK